MEQKRGCIKWKVRRIANSALYDVYLSSGKTDKQTFSEETIKADYDVFRLYDSRNLKPLFYAGHLRQDFDIFPATIIDGSRDSFVESIKKHLEELPDGFYSKKERS